MVATPTRIPNVPEQERLVEDYLDAHPWSTIIAIREGIQAETGILIERIQGRLDRIGKRRIIHRDPTPMGQLR